MFIEKSLANVNVSFHPMVSGRFYSSQLVNATTTLALAANTLYAVPVLVSSLITATSINIEVTAQSAGNNLRLGIYTDSSGVPDSLVLDAGTVSLTGTGGKTIAISQSLAAGWYWLAGVTNGTPTVRALAQSGAISMLGFTSGTDTANHVGFSVAFTYGTLPNPFQGGGALMTTAAPRFMIGI